MNILFYCPFIFNLNSKNLLTLGGIESLNYELCNELAKKKLNIYLATYTNREIKKNNLINIPIKKILNKNNMLKIDIIISSNEPKIFNIFKSAKKILWLHNTLSIEKSIRKKKIISILRNKISAVFVSKYLKEKTSKLFFFNKKIIINNFLSRKFIIKNLNYKRKQIIVWSVQREKGLNKTLQMWIENVYPKNSKLNLYILGIDKKKFNNKEKKLRKYNIFFLGRKPKNQLKRIYSKSLAMICLGYDETFCLNALEANACGLPLVTFAKTALKNYSKNNFNSYIVENYDQIADKILFMSENKVDRKIINNSFKSTKVYRIEKIVRLWTNLFKKI